MSENSNTLVIPPKMMDLAARGLWKFLLWNAHNVQMRYTQGFQNKNIERAGCISLGGSPNRRLFTYTTLQTCTFASQSLALNQPQYLGSYDYNEVKFYNQHHWLDSCKFSLFKAEMMKNIIICALYKLNLKLSDVKPQWLSGKVIGLQHPDRCTITK